MNHYQHIAARLTQHLIGHSDSDTCLMDHEKALLEQLNEPLYSEDFDITHFDGLEKELKQTSGCVANYCCMIIWLLNPNSQKENALALLDCHFRIVLREMANRRGTRFFEWAVRSN